MVKENEIMCGNYFIHNDNWCSREHKGIFQFDSQHFFELHECTFYLENVSPIPLTKDILIRCGFENYESEHFCLIESRNIMLYKRDSEWLLMASDRNTTNKCTSNIKHLHTLQNLVKLLCNQTIELK